MPDAFTATMARFGELLSRGLPPEPALTHVADQLAAIVEHDDDTFERLSYVLVECLRSARRALDAGDREEAEAWADTALRWGRTLFPVDGDP